MPNGGLLEEGDVCLVGNFEADFFSGIKKVRALLRLHPEDPPERTEKGQPGSQINGFVGWYDLLWCDLAWFGASTQIFYEEKDRICF